MKNSKTDFCPLKWQKVKTQKNKFRDWKGNIKIDNENTQTIMRTYFKKLYFIKLKKSKRSKWISRYILSVKVKSM